MKFDFYLSEMSVSDKHGGGLTLIRILGDDLQEIPYFFHVNRFGADNPAKQEFLGRSIDLQSFWETDLIRKIIGRSLSHRISKKLFTIKQHAAKAARSIAGKLKDEQDICGLICPQGANAIFTLEALKQIRPVKYVTWVMDDHLVEYVDDQWQYPEGMEAVFARHLQQARHVFVISPAMQAFYKERFGINSTVLFGSANTVAQEQIFNSKSGKAIKIGYFGAVAAWQRDALKAVADALPGTEVQLDIYSGVQHLPAELAVDGVNFKGNLSPENVPDAMKNYDAVLLPISFEQKIRNMSEFNIATKMSEYLACGVPVLAVGPPYAAMMQYLDKHHAAITVTSRQDSDIRQAFDQLQDANRNTVILKNALALVANEVGEQPMRLRWEQGIGEATTDTD